MDKILLFKPYKEVCFYIASPLYVNIYLSTHNCFAIFSSLGELKNVIS